MRSIPASSRTLKHGAPRSAAAKFQTWAALHPTVFRLPRPCVRYKHVLPRRATWQRTSLLADIVALHNPCCRQAARTRDLVFLFPLQRLHRFAASSPAIYSHPSGFSFAASSSSLTARAFVTFSGERGQLSVLRTHWSLGLKLGRRTTLVFAQGTARRILS